ncbi:sigma-70 family RNA polymerase sigma factor [Clostridium swellfunianum]|uniref:sigma-70 family RNA polymerase sigma factor n=1 Tax=Clostridium swellfunianum TaxID=1367462 RepID=UPI00202F40D8|nr:sigma-70 family RNA polymerase sigma factor [Clostridium swellfunianum]MCM0649333.1 sigma-70 family RNA polymerase sigma factor [Clostridium swellfunianum]
MSEEELVIAAQSGDNEAFYKLMSLYSKSLYKIAYSYLESQQEALEAVQETTCRAFIKLKKLKQTKYFKTWVTKILINYCIDEVKRNKKLTELTIEIEAINSTSEDDMLDIEIALNKLDSRYKEVVVLKYFQDMTTQDIASILDCPEGTVKTWLHRGLNSLRNYFKKDGDLNV